MSRLLDTLDRERAHAVATLPGGAALTRRRDEAWREFAMRGLPTVREEAWKYTSLARLDDAEAVAAPDPDPAQVEVLLRETAIEGLSGPRLVFVNGRLLPEATRPAREEGLEMLRLADALASQDSSADLLDRIVDARHHRFALLNTALLADGALIRVTADANIETPVHLVFLTVGTDGDLAVTQNRVLIEAQANSRVRIIEHYAGAHGQALCNAVTEIHAGPGSRLTHYRVQEQSVEHAHVASLSARITRDARLTCHNTDLGGGLVRNDVHARLEETGAGVALYGLYVTDARRHVDNHTRIDHIAAHTDSDEEYRGVLSGRSRAVFNGKVYVARDAQKTAAAQSNSNLLLDRHCEVDTKPELEIYADDVKCSHGATVGQIDETALFYLRSRGLDLHAARSVLTYAFAGAMFDRLESPTLRTHLARHAAGHLPGDITLEAGS